MDWSALQDLIAVADTGSLSGAARRLGMSQPTIGRRIEQLEHSLNAVLVNRSPQGLTLTPVGEQVLSYAQHMADDALAIERIASGANQQLEGVVRITLTDMLGVKWLPSKLPEFYGRFPGLRLELVVENRTLDLIKREADIAIRFARPKQLDLVTRRTVDFHYGLYASHGYIGQHGQPGNIRDFKQHYFVSYDETVFQIPQLKRLEKMVGGHRIVYRSTSISGILAAVEEGIGIGITSCYISDTRTGLQRLQPDRFDFSFTAWVTTHADLFKSTRIKSVFDFLVEKLEEDKLLFRGSYPA